MDRRKMLILSAGGAMALGAAALAQTESNPFPAPAALPVHPELPDPFTRFIKGKINTAEEWRKVRRPELQTLFRYYMYGTEPPAAKVAASVEREDKAALGGKATLREVTLSFGPAGTRPIHLLEVLPNKRKGRAPVFLGLAFCGNQAVLPDPKIRMAEGWMYAGPGVKDNRATGASASSTMMV